MRLNLGCGFNKKDGFINVDKFAVCEPDIVLDLELIPWQFKTDKVDEVIFNHSLEHIGGDTEVFFGIIKELYRICKAGALIQINVPHPRHDNFLNDPTHVRLITPELLGLFSKRLNHEWKEKGVSNSPLAIYLDVDFEIKAVTHVLEKKYMTLLNDKQISEQELVTIISERNNIVSEYQITLEVIK